MWHYVQNGQGFGPVDAAVVQSMLKSGSLAPDSLVWKEGMRDWAPAHSLAEFAAGIPSPDAPPPVPPLTMPPKNPGGSANPDPADIEHNKVFAVLAYLGILFLVPLLAAPRSPFARYHANQGIILFIAMVVVSMARDVPFVGGLIWSFHNVLWPVLIIFAVLGIVHAASGQCKPLPLIGHFQLLT
jgi:uncharacterized membrane protein